MYKYNDSKCMTWKIEKEAILLLGGSRAILMQLAHPLIAVGSYEHSYLISDPFRRARHTLRHTQISAFGSDMAACHTARTINRLHGQVHGTLAMDAGAYTRGTPYRARDPQLLLWAHATLVDTALRTYALFFGPLSSAEKEQYYHESKMRVRLLGLPLDAIPRTVLDLEQYINETLYSNRLAATPQARELVQKVLFPSASTLFRPLTHFNLFVTCALLPQPIREIYGLQWSKRQQHKFDLLIQRMRAVLPYTPRYIRELPSTRSMMRQGAKKP
ncbi:MAG: oxygenase MpaB family protein [Ktedonobacteraceae bacterium]